MTKRINVAVGILQKPDRSFLLTSRPTGKGWAGWWEFPGGKIEQDETPVQALTRELQEELGIQIKACQPWVIRQFDYPATHDAEPRSVHLHFHFVTAWQGTPSGIEGQELIWQNPERMICHPILPANAPIIHALALPEIYGISHIAEMGERLFLFQLEKALENGLKMMQFRENTLPEEEWIRVSQKVLSLCQRYGCKCLLNGDPQRANHLGFDGAHLTSTALMAINQKPHTPIIGASCHNAQQLAQALSLEMDFVVLSPIKPTRSHPEATPLGWDNFKNMVSHYPLPVYALGGMLAEDLPIALASGGRGIAMQRSIWGA